VIKRLNNVYLRLTTHYHLDIVPRRWARDSSLDLGSRDLPDSTQNPPQASGAPATIDATSFGCLLETLERQCALLEKILSALLNKRDVRAGPAEGILAEYLRPEELAAEFRIRETQLSEWKRKGFGPPRTRVRQLVVYRREAVLRWLLSLEEGPGG
jgi:hypothetical protein